MSVAQHLDDVFQTVVRRNPHEVEFHQAVREVIDSLGPVLEQHPEYVEASVLDRLVEPERQIVFRVPWVDDQGRVRVNRGFRTEFSSVLGPYKGGLRFHPSVNAAIIKFLGFEQVFKNALTGIALGGGKGGSDFDPHGRSDGEVMRFCQSFMTELYRHLGEHTDVPAGDIGVGAREVGYLFGQYKRIVNRWEAGVLTGKGLAWGGSLARTEATGFGTVLFAAEALAARGLSLEGKRVVVSGSGNVAIYAVAKAQQLGANVVAVSDSKGAVLDERGIDLEVLRQVREVERLPVAEYAARRQGALYEAGARPWGFGAQVALPCATQNELDDDDARALLDSSVIAVVEGANMPTTPKAIALLQENHVLFAPGKAANAGGVATSGLEMQQNASRDVWTFEQTEARLARIVRDIHERCLATADRFGVPGDYVAGANIAGFTRVADAMLAMGVV